MVYCQDLCRIFSLFVHRISKASSGYTEKEDAAYLRMLVTVQKKVDTAERNVTPQPKQIETP